VKSTGYSSMTAALECGKWSAAGPGSTLPSAKTWYPLYRGLGGPQSRSGRRKISSPPRFDPGSSSPKSVSIPTELPGPHYIYIYIHEVYLSFSTQMIARVRTTKRNFYCAIYGAPSFSRSSLVQSLRRLYLASYNENFLQAYVNCMMFVAWLFNEGLLKGLY